MLSVLGAGTSCLAAPRSRAASVLTVVGLLLLAGSPQAQSPSDEFVAYAQVERERLTRRLSAEALAEAKAREALERGQNALALAERLQDQAAVPVARLAIANAEKALAQIRAARTRDQARLEALNRATAAVLQTVTVAPGSPGYVSWQRGTVQRSGGKPLDAPLVPGDEIRTGADGQLELAFPSGDRVALAPNSALRIGEGEEKDRGLLELGKGVLHNIVQCLERRLPRCNPYRVRTSLVTLAVRGTEYELVAAEDGSGSIVVFAGTVEVEDRRTRQIRLVRAGECVTMGRDGSLTDPSPHDRNSQRRWWEPD